jgi:peptidoglycan/xylan/chitin deacetylase (PgdA/CDA1 family)
MKRSKERANSVWLPAFAQAIAAAALPREIEEILYPSSRRRRRLGALELLKNGRAGVSLARFITGRAWWRYFHLPSNDGAFNPPRLALTFDCDYEEDTNALPGLITLLKAEGVSASVACIGALVQRQAKPYGRLLDHGHEIINHSATHPFHRLLNAERSFDSLSESDVYEEMCRCQEVLRKGLGHTAKGFRTPHFADSRAVFRAAERVGFSYLSSVARDRSVPGRPYYVARESVLGDLFYATSQVDAARCYPFLMIPLDCCPAHPGEPFSSYHTIRGDFGTPGRMRGRHRKDGDFLRLWELVLARSFATGSLCIYLDLVDLIGCDEKENLLREMIRRALSMGWVFVTMSQLCNGRSASEAKR